MLVREAREIVGGLSNPSKMPCHGTSLPARACPVGAKLAKVKGSTCEGCYAMKGMYGFSTVQRALERRLAALDHPQWIEAMVLLVSRERSGFFRWHDSGDLQGMTHLKQVVAVATATPRIRHWLPTREYALIGAYLREVGPFPPNLTVRVSAVMVDRAPCGGSGLPTSTVRTRDDSEGATGWRCPAPQQGGECRDCRACWDANVRNVSYSKH